ncbi:hypothetical protein [Thiothrix unzii]|jgi:hypothetical protein|uniref:hypothetical protein n=1 Tax=Thiothrix unzii TaxID=111769 RepID=UPI002A36A6CC|nr:hypothetical protein [Thiothrix unzii]MDX9988722.1 hypothetical protein [Thiothrix unzii]
MTKNIAKYIDNTGFLFNLLYTLLVLAGVEFLVFFLGFIIAIPTDLGRSFAYSASAFFGILAAYFCISFLFLKILIKLRRIQKILKICKQRS